MAIPLPDTRSLSDDVRAALRLRAVAARAAGFANDTVAAILGLRPESVSRWFAAYQRGHSIASIALAQRSAVIDIYDERAVARLPRASDGRLCDLVAAVVIDLIPEGTRARVA